MRVGMFQWARVEVGWGWTGKGPRLSSSRVGCVRGWIRHLVAVDVCVKAIQIADSREDGGQMRQ